MQRLLAALLIPVLTTQMEIVVALNYPTDLNTASIVIILITRAMMVMLAQSTLTLTGQTFSAIIQSIVSRVEWARLLCPLIESG